jgi:probable F420-dependent oxidoreductase
VKFSVSLPTSYEGLGYPIGFAGDGTAFARLARAAEALGYDGVWGNDHLVTPRFLRGTAGGPPRFFEVIVVLAHVAAATERIRLGTAVIALPLRDLVVLAKQVATLDVLSRGRVSLGVGVGAYREELEAVRPGAAGPRGADLEERLAALRLLLDEGGGTRETGSVRFADVELAPRPLQRPLPIFVGGHTEAAIDRAVRFGQGWMPGWQPVGELRRRVGLLRERASAAGRDARSIEVAVELSAAIAPRHEDATARYEASRFVRHRRSRDRTGRDAALMARSNLVGGPDAIRERVRELAEAGVDHCAAIAFPAETVDEVIEQWTLFAEEIVGARRYS